MGEGYSKAGVKREGAAGEYTARGHKSTPAMGKEVKDTEKVFAKGGTTKMFGRQHAGPKSPGRTEHTISGDGGKFISGGSTKMYGKGSASPMPAGQTGKNSN